MVYRVYVEKKPGQTHEASGLFKEVQEFLQIKGLENVRVLNRYDAENLEKALFDYAVNTVFSEPQVDNVTYDVPEGQIVFAVEPLPGQFDQRADSAAQCIQILSQGERPTVRTAKVYVLEGKLSEEQITAIRRHVINPVECREASLDMPTTLELEVTVPEQVATVEGFLELDKEGLAAMVKDLGLAMDLDDITFCQAYFKTENRNPTITEIRMIDTYWSDHCRHTTFNTTIDNVKFEENELAPPNTVLYQTISTDTEVEVGTKIGYTLAKAPEVILPPEQDEPVPEGEDAGDGGEGTGNDTPDTENQPDENDF